MTFIELDTFTYIGNEAIINGVSRTVTGTPTGITAVQYHRGRDYLLEEPLMTKVPFTKYQGILEEWESAEVIPVESTQDELDNMAREKALLNLTVTTSEGNEFDADDTARADMLSAIIAADTLSLTNHNWKLADNTWKVISLAELKEASALAIQAKGNILAS